MDIIFTRIKKAAVFFAMLLAWPVHGQAWSGSGQDLIVGFKAGHNTSLMGEWKSKTNVMRARAFRSIAGVQHWQLASPMDASKIIQQLQADPNVDFAEPNYPRYLRPVLMPNDPLFGDQWAMHNTGQYTGAIPNIDMNLPEAWAIQTGSQNVVVAVIDDSVDINHSDLYANIWTNPGEIPGNGIDDDNNGFIDDVHGWDFVANDNDPSATPGRDEGHGTNVAGCIGAAGNNGRMMSGVNWNVSVMPLKFFGDVAGELAALDYAINNGAKIVNASWGGPQFSRAESAGMVKLRDNGILLVAAAGNNDGNNDKVADYPSSLPYPNILAVAAHDIRGQYTSWTHVGQTNVDLAAPGLSVISLATSDSYTRVSGTSFSSPYVAGVAALVLAQYPTSTYQEIKGRIMASTVAMNELGLSATDGRLDAATALSISPQPEIVISSLSLHDSNNQLLDNSESVQLSITLENVWQAATGISATLSSSDALLSIDSPTQTYADLAMGQKGSAVFDLQTRRFSGYKKFPMTLTIHTGAFTFTRHFFLDSGTLIAEQASRVLTMQNDQDEFQSFHIDVPAGQPYLNISADAAVDVDLLVRFDAAPQFDFATYFDPTGRDAQTLISANPTGAEQVLISNPQAGTWHVVVVNFAQLPDTYTIKASLTSDQALLPGSTTVSSTTQTSGCLSLSGLTPSSLGLFAMLLVLHLRRRYKN